MKKQEIIKIFKEGHEEFKKIISLLSYEQIESFPAVGVWSVRNVIAHISAWNWEQVEEIDRTLVGNSTWNRKTSGETSNTDRFNKEAVEKRKDWSIKKLMSEWENSFTFLLKKIENLRDKEFMCDGMQNIFKYELEGGSDEMRHAKEIEKRFNLHTRSKIDTGQP